MSNNVVSLASYRTGASERWLNKRQAANHLGVSTRWVERRQLDGGMPFYRVGGSNLYRASELDAWVVSHVPLTQ